MLLLCDGPMQRPARIEHRHGVGASGDFGRKIKGIALLSSADFTHPAWLAELKKTWFRLKTAILNFKA